LVSNMHINLYQDQVNKISRLGATPGPGHGTRTQSGSLPSPCSEARGPGSICRDLDLVCLHKASIPRTLSPTPRMWFGDSQIRTRRAGVGEDAGLQLTARSLCRSLKRLESALFHSRRWSQPGLRRSRCRVR
jgi:hypothetical protein